MHVVICPDKFAGTLSAVEAATALAGGWREVAPEDELVIRPLADGGPGFVDVLTENLSGRLIPVHTVDPLGRPVMGAVLVAGRTAYVESAQACGLHLLAPGDRDPRTATSYGLGPLISAATETGVREIVVGLGGSATNDAGAGMLAALGAPALDAAGYALPYGGAALIDCAGLGGVPRLRGATLIAATDVDNPLTGPAGASAVYGPQKGATIDDIVLLDSALARFCAVLEKELATCPPGLAGLAGGGAAGGLGAAILALGGRCESGFGLVRAACQLDQAIAAADLVITGEGSFDHQSLRGKVVAGVAAAARDSGVPCVVAAGRVTVHPEEARVAGVTASYSLVEQMGSVAAAISGAAEGLRALGATLAMRGVSVAKRTERDPTLS